MTKARLILSVTLLVVPIYIMCSSYKDPDVKSVFEEEECNKGAHIVSNIVTSVLLMD